MATVNKRRASLPAMLLSGAMFLSVAVAGAGAAPDGKEKAPLCDGDYVAEVIVLDVEKQTLGDFVRHLNEKYEANIALDPDLADITFSMAKVRGRWVTLLKIIMEQNRLKKECREGIARIRRRK
jgi:hypothetical protein